MAKVSQFKYVHKYTDSRGVERIYFRHKQVRVALPAPIGGKLFKKAYEAALSGTPLDQEDRLAVVKQLNADGKRRVPTVGVYLLFNQGYLAYIGSSLNIPSRIAGHKKNGRPFDEAFFIATKVEDRLRVEQVLIEAMRPPGNLRRTKQKPRMTSGEEASQIQHLIH